MNSIQQLSHTNAQVAAEILALSHAAYDVEASLIGAQDFPPLSETQADIVASPDLFLGYIYQETLAGVIQVEVVGDLCTISRLVVSPEYFRRGIGSALLAHILEQSSHHYQVQTALKNEPVLALYAKFGFGQVKTWVDERTGITLVLLATAQRSDS